MKSYRCLLFDLFSTVALWLPERMPQLQYQGETRPSTLGVLATLLAAHHPQITFDEFHAAVTRTNAALADEKATSGREIASAERFRRTLASLGLPGGHATDALAAAMSRQHMDILRDVTIIPDTHREVLARLANAYPIALVSNFDHTETAIAILHRDGVADYFDHILVSDHHGWRKPHPRIFNDALAQLGCGAAEALFIGDSVEDDLAGAHGVGLDAAWVNRRGVTLPPGTPAPQMTIGDITELAPVLL